jgi:hypothetical protein
VKSFGLAILRGRKTLVLVRSLRKVIMAQVIY